MADKLLPCPFCGGVAEADYQQPYRDMSRGHVDHGAAIYCTSCNASMIICRGDHPELTDEDRMAIMVENWNRRAAPPQRAAFLPTEDGEFNGNVHDDPTEAKGQTDE